jgi:hypothetical protein
MLKGILSSLYFAEEATEGIASVGNYYRLPLLSESISRESTLVEEDRIAYLNPEATVLNESNKTVSGAFTVAFSNHFHVIRLIAAALGSTVVAHNQTEFNAFPNGVEWLQRGSLYAVGSDVYVCVKSGYKTAGAPSLTPNVDNQNVGTAVVNWFVNFEQVPVYKNTISVPAGARTKSLSFLRQIPNSGVDQPAFLYRGAKLSQLSVSLAVDGAGSISGNIEAMDESYYPMPPAVDLVANSVREPFIGKDGTIEVPLAPPWWVTALNISFANPLDVEDFRIGYNTRSRIPANKPDYTGSMEMYFPDMDVYNTYRSGLTVPVLYFTCIHNTNIVRLTLNNLRFFGEGDPTIVSAKAIRETLKFKFTSVGLETYTFPTYLVSHDGKILVTETGARFTP